ncbi:Predicted alpha-1,6-mannanase, GH76 family [Nakamurella panacisegetis]|uniref:Predicted alpha-1,6-mannanase, GH76 family n=1 Tax=Nakamurella panacisegetis TaxID=1090615 RepID=A0A1H0QZQ2_9ACTN|nr:glycoside hydrolase family 76 protein [Nakamurella panacisegetis]SDP22409.1 Predicted alpha-1,6-mannanase, GH76 family [Nakamurella panacisegetis]
MTGPDWAHRAQAAESAVLGRHLRTLGLPGTRLGVVSWPAAPSHRVFLRWHFWWQAHLLDCAVDAWLRSPDATRGRRIRVIARSIRLRNGGRFTNDYNDDMAWIGLALHRAVAAGVDPRSIRPIVTALLDAWQPPSGGIRWRRGDEFYNAPANGPTAILLARTGFHRRAVAMTDWIDANLHVPGSGLMADGLVPGQPVQPTFYTYNQGSVLGAEVALTRVGHDRGRVHRLVDAVDAELTTGGVLIGHGGGNGGLFTGILARYLAVVAAELPGDSTADRRARSRAARLVLDSASAAWAHRVVAPHGPLFGADWTVLAQIPTRRPVGASDGARIDPSEQPERDLSVQLSAWMLLEAAARLADRPLAAAD